MNATRRKAREWAVQMLTAADLNPPGDDLAFTAAFWRQIKSLGPEDGGSDGDLVRGKLRSFAEERFLGVRKDIEAIDAALAPFLDNWQMIRLGTVERAVLRLAAWELRYTGIPSAIVINEAIDLANWYSSPKARSLVNSVLDHYAKSIETERAPLVEAVERETAAKKDLKKKEVASE